MSVIDFPGITRINLDPQRILDASKEANLESVIVLGYTKDGCTYFASSLADGADALWLLEMSKAELIAAARELTEEA